MIQEIIALAIFVAALLYAVITIIMVLVPAKNKAVQSCGSSSCGCGKINNNLLQNLKSREKKTP